MFGEIFFYNTRYHRPKWFTFREKNSRKVRPPDYKRSDDSKAPFIENHGKIEIFKLLVKVGVGAGLDFL